jgi:hypothetical protein
MFNIKGENAFSKNKNVELTEPFIGFSLKNENEIVLKQKENYENFGEYSLPFYDVRPYLRLRSYRRNL